MKKREDVGRDVDYLTVAEAAELLRTTEKAIYNRISRGDLDGLVIRDGRRRLIDRLGLIRRLEDSRVGA